VQGTVAAAAMIVCQPLSPNAFILSRHFAPCKPRVSSTVKKPPANDANYSPTCAFHAVSVNADTDM
jgi:hypothetical protein